MNSLILKSPIYRFIVLFMFLNSFIILSQKSENISTVDFVQILNNNEAEAIFYFENNWKILRKMAIEKGYIKSFEFLVTSFSKNAPFNFIFITTYKNKEQFLKREQNFQELIKIKGNLKLLNNKKPNDFRKTIFSKEEVFHRS